MTPKQKAEYVACKMRFGEDIAKAYSLRPREWGRTHGSGMCNYRLTQEQVYKLKTLSSVISCERKKGHKGLHVDADCRSENSEHCVIVWMKDTILVKEY